MIMYPNFYFYLLKIFSINKTRWHSDFAVQLLSFPSAALKLSLFLFTIYNNKHRPLSSYEIKLSTLPGAMRETEIETIHYTPYLIALVAALIKVDLDKKGAVYQKRHRAYFKRMEPAAVIINVDNASRG